MSRVKHLTNSGFGGRVVEFLNIAYKDYIAARLLLHSGLLPQGAVLASTAVEKYFKAILAFRGNEARGHLSKKHINGAFNYDRNLRTVLDSSFLQLLQKAYDIRYIDDLPKDFNIVIAQREVLAELDHTAVTIQESFRMQLNGKDATFSYEIDKQNRNPILLLDNHVIMRVRKQEFISAQPQSVYELRNCPRRGLLEATYVSKARESDGCFLRETFRPKDEEGMSYQLALAPLEESSGAA